MGLECHGGLRARVVDHVNRTAQLVAVEHLGVHARDVGARFEKPRQLVERVVDHEVHIERDVRQLRELLHHGNAHGEVGNEMPVHHVDVDIARARLLDHADIAAEVHEVSRKNGGRYGHRLKHGRAPCLPITPPTCDVLLSRSHSSALGACGGHIEQ